MGARCCAAFGGSRDAPVRVGFALCAAEERAPIFVRTGGGLGAAGELHGEADGEWEKHVAAAYGEDGSADQYARGCAAAGICGGFADFDKARGSGGSASSRGGVAKSDFCAEG